VPGVEVRLLDERGAAGRGGRPRRGGRARRQPVPRLLAGRVRRPDADGWFATGDVACSTTTATSTSSTGGRTSCWSAASTSTRARSRTSCSPTPRSPRRPSSGIPHPYTGEAVKALVVRTPGSRLTAEELIAHAASSLARFKCPTAVEFVPELPRGATGKVRKGRLRELA
jgi:long-chain acyl-CoA synthetase